MLLEKLTFEPNITESTGVEQELRSVPRGIRTQGRSRRSVWLVFWTRKGENGKCSSKDPAPAQLSRLPWCLFCCCFFFFWWFPESAKAFLLGPLVPFFPMPQPHESSYGLPKRPSSFPRTFSHSSGLWLNSSSAVRLSLTTWEVKVPHSMTLNNSHPSTLLLFFIALKTIFIYLLSIFHLDCKLQEAEWSFLWNECLNAWMKYWVVEK